MQICRHCKMSDSEVNMINQYDGYSDDWVHESCQRKSTAEFRAFLDNFRQSKGLPKKYDSI